MREARYGSTGSLVQDVDDPVTILVPEMHGAGASTLCGILQALGVAFPGCGPHDTTSDFGGSFENSAVFELQRTFLAGLGSRWDDPLPLPPAWPRSAVAKAFCADIQNEVFRRFADEPIFAVSAPQLCLLMPAWTAAARPLNRPVVSLFAFQHPLTTAQALQASDNLPRAHGLMLWLKYGLAAERASREMPRCFVDHDALLTDWRSCARKIASDLKFTWPRDGLRVASDIDDAVRQTESRPDKWQDSGDSLQQLCGKALAAFGRLVEDAADKEAMATLDAIDRDIASAAALFGPLIAGSERKLATSHIEHRARLDALQGEADRRSTIIADRDAALEEAAEKASTLEREITSHRTALAKAIDEHERMRSQLASSIAEVDAWRARQSTLAEERDSLVVHAEKLGDEIAQATLTLEHERASRIAEGDSLRNERDQTIRDRRQAVRLIQREAASHEKGAIASRAANRVLRERLEGARCSHAVDVASLKWRHALERRRTDATSARLRDDHRDLTRRLDDAGRSIAILEQRLQAKTAEIAAITGSRTWALTKPFRALGKRRPRKDERRDAPDGAPPSQPTADEAHGLAEQGSPDAASLALADELQLQASTEEPSGSLAQQIEKASERGDFPLPGYVAAMSELAASPPRHLDVVISIVIPTYNAGAEFYWLLMKLRAQQGVSPVEIVIVDSGSTDGTVDLAERAGCVVVKSDKDDFSHSHTRNLGAEAARGELLLFMVQDAYPVGDFWLHAMATALLHPRNESERMAALSCAEYPRADSELFYNTQIAIHYRFLGCEDADRIGRMIGTDSHSLRVQGQLSDIACLISRDLFLQYRYQGRYAEDLLIGLQLVKDGHKAGLLSSLRVIHSHTRPRSYQVRRVFVDILFLSEVFHDQFVPRASSVIGTAMAGYALQTIVDAWQPANFANPVVAIDALADRLTTYQLPAVIPVLDGDGFGFAPLGSWIEDFASRSERTGQPPDEDDIHDAGQVRNMFADRLRSIQAQAASVYGGMDETVAVDLTNAVEKSLAMSAGANLAFIYLNAAAAGGADPIATLKPMLLEGI